MVKKWLKRWLFKGEDKDVKAEYLHAMQRLDVKDGDVIVLRTEHLLSKATADNVCATVKDVLGEYGFNVHVMCLDGGAEIGILRKETLNGKS